MTTESNRQPDPFITPKKALLLIVFGAAFSAVMFLYVGTFYSNPAFYIGLAATVLGIGLLLLDLRARLHVLEPHQHAKEMHTYIGPIILLLFSVGAVMWATQRMRTDFSLMLVSIVLLGAFWGIVSYGTLLSNIKFVTRPENPAEQSSSKTEAAVEREYDYDAFIAHASEDKEAIVRGHYCPVKSRIESAGWGH